MHNLILSVACFSALFAFALTIAGLGSLMAFSDAEVDDFARRHKSRQKLNPLSTIWFLLQIDWKANRETISRLPSHWRTRPDARGLMWWGLAFAIIALVSFCWLATTMV
jgi:hypothetical protein